VPRVNATAISTAAPAEEAASINPRQLASVGTRESETVSISHSALLPPAAIAAVSGTIVALPLQQAPAPNVTGLVSVPATAPLTQRGPIFSPKTTPAPGDDLLPGEFIVPTSRNNIGNVEATGAPSASLHLAASLQPLQQQPVPTAAPVPLLQSSRM